MEALLEAQSIAKNQEEVEKELPSGDHMMVNGQVKLNPYNFNNKLVTKNEIENLLKKYGVYQNINDLNLYQNAFVHESYCVNKVQEIIDRDEVQLIKRPEGALELQPKSNETLEYLGDAILSGVIASYLFERFPKEQEGFLSKMRTKLVNKHALAHLTRVMKLEPYLLISRHTEDMCGGRVKDRYLEDMFEALLGAIYLDFNSHQINIYNSFFSGTGFQVTQRFILNLIEDEDTGIDFTDLILNDTNYKDQLIKYFQRVYKKTPTYNKVKVDGTINNRIFTIEIENLEGSVIGTARGKTVKEAQQLASKRALIGMGLIEEEDYPSDVE